MSPEGVETREARWGSRMIEVRIRFWTDQIAEGKGQIRPKNAWDSGVILLARNPSHGISPGPPLPFNGLAEIPAKLEKVLRDHGLKLRLSARQKKLFVTD